MDNRSKYSFKAFSETDDYQKVNADIVRHWVSSMLTERSKQIGSLLDIATGMGTMVQLFLNQLPGQKPTVICLDQDESSLVQTTDRLKSLSFDVKHLHTSVEDLELPDESVDVAIWGNAIHYLQAEGQERALTAIRRVLKKRGWLFFNTAFYAEARPPETLVFYRAQVRKAVSHLNSLGIQRDRAQKRPAASNFPPASHYETLLTKIGFSVNEMRQVAARLHQPAWEHLSSFRQYAAGALHGYVPEVAADAMREAVAPAIEKHGQRDENNAPYVLRNWLAVSARRENLSSGVTSM
ncbi:MAG: class I SAM-dependent methyltransferase [Trueperaceae bacterium]|nr:MAG: class I SAM-dependent methyltransferase [Trueperaceae bacterium]